MSLDDKPPRLSEDMGTSPMRGHLESLTGSQLKTLLMVAADPAAETDTATMRAAEVARHLAELSGSRDADDLLATAAKETTSVEELVRLKELAKTWAGEAADRPHRDAARLLYHVAVAAAFVHHAAAISGRPPRKQQRLYEEFADAWIGHSIGRVFREAAARLSDAEPQPPRPDGT
jgi:hypothetical protein